MAGQRESSLLEVDGEEFLKGLEAAFNDLEVKSEAGLERLGIQVANRAKAFCPVATGRLRAAIKASPVGHDEQGPYIDVGVGLDDLNSEVVVAQQRISANAKAGKRVSKKLASRAQEAHVNYAIYVEYGTSKMAPQPFMRPALAEVAGYIGPTIGPGGRKPLGPRKSGP